MYNVAPLVQFYTVFLSTHATVSAAKADGHRRSFWHQQSLNVTTLLQFTHTRSWPWAVFQNICYKKETHSYLRLTYCSWTNSSDRPSYTVCANPSGRAVCCRSPAEIVGSNPAGEHGWISVVCCQVQVSWTGQSLVQRSTTECDCEASKTRRPWPIGGPLHPARKYNVFRAEYAPTRSHISTLLLKYDGEANLKPSRCNKMTRKKSQTA